MCKIISSDSVIGNFVFEVVEKRRYEIEINELLKFERELSKKLKDLDYYTNFSTRCIINFMESYPFFVKSVSETTITINQEVFQHEKLSCKLERYFRLGIPYVVVDNMTEVYQNIVRK